MIAEGRCRERLDDRVTEDDHEVRGYLQQVRLGPRGYRYIGLDDRVAEKHGRRVTRSCRVLVKNDYLDPTATSGQYYKKEVNKIQKSIVNL